VTLSAASPRRSWIPPGFAHGFYVLSAHAQFLYKTTDYWYPEAERSLLRRDPALGIGWPLDGEPIVAAKTRRPARGRGRLRVVGSRPAGRSAGRRRLRDAARFLCRWLRAHPDAPVSCRHAPESRMRTRS
jgi:hypothetical protein